MLKHIGQSRGRGQGTAVLTVVAPAGEGVAGRGSDALKVIDNGIRFGEGLLIEHLTGGSGQMSLGEIRNVVVDGDGAVLLDKNRNLAFLGSGRINIILRKHISRGRGKCAQRHGRIVGGNGHVLGAARHHLTGGLIHKLDGDIVRDALEHRSKGNIAFTLIPEHMRKHIGQSGSRGQCAGGITIVLPLDKLIAALRDGIQDGIVGVILLRHGYGVIVYIR